MLKRISIHPIDHWSMTKALDMIWHWKVENMVQSITHVGVQYYIPSEDRFITEVLVVWSAEREYSSLSLTKSFPRNPAGPLRQLINVFICISASLLIHILSTQEKKICLQTFWLCLKPGNNIEWIVHVKICIISNSSPRFVWSSMSLSTKSFVTNLR